MPRTKKTTASRARTLRQDITDAEHLLWRHLRDGALDGAEFRQRETFGRYVVDFVCVERGIAIEAVGDQRAAQAGKGSARDRYLRARGFDVLRFRNQDILADVDGVVEQIRAALEEG